MKKCLAVGNEIKADAELCWDEKITAYWFDLR